MASKAVHTQIDGLDYIVSVPEGTEEDDYQYGLIIGPPEELAELEFNCEDFARRLHKELFVRGLITHADVTRRRSDVTSALMSVLKLEGERIIEVYGGNNGRK